MIGFFHILIGGWRQRFGQPDNGLSGIEYDILSRHGCSDDTNRLCDISYLHWHVSAADFVRRCYSFGDFRSPCRPRIQIAGYSYGGQTAVNMCREFQSLGVTVDCLTLVDPVKRRSAMPWGWLAAFNRYATIRVPGNVDDVIWFYQRRNWPRSHRVVTMRGTPQEIQLPTRHSSIDNHTRVRVAILEHAARIHNIQGDINETIEQ